MALVPQRRTRQQVGQVAQTAPQKTAQDFGASIAEPLAQAGKAMQESAQREFVAANIAVVQEAETKLYEWENEALYGDDGLYRKKGRDSMGASDQLLTSFDVYSSEVMANLTNDKQRMAFEQTLSSRRKDLLSSSSRYQYQELQSYKAEQSTAYIANSQVAAANHYENPQRVQEEINRQIDSIRATSAANGLSPEQTRLQIDVAKSTTHSNVLERMLSNEQYDQAKAYFDLNQDSLLPDQRDKASQMVSAGSAIQASQSATDDIMAMDLSEKDALSYARSNYSGEERDNVVQRVKVRYGEKEQAKIFSDRQASEVAYTQILAGQNIDVVNAVNLTDATRRSLERFKQAQASNEPIKTAPAYRAQLDFMANDHPGQFMSVNLLQFRGDLSNEDFNTYQSLQNSMIRDAEEAKKNGSPFAPKSEFYNAKTYTAKASRDFGLYNPSKTESKQSSEHKDYYAKFADHVDMALIDAQQLKGKKLTWEEQKQIIDQEAAFWKVSVSKPAFIFDDDVMVGNLTEEDLAQGGVYVDIDGVPQDVSAKLTEYLITNKIPPTEENILHAFRENKHL